MSIQLRIQEKESPMRAWHVTWLSIVVAVTFLVIPPAWASEHRGHLMVTPADLQWADQPALPPGAKFVILEGSLSEAAPFIFRVKFPAGYQVPAHWHPVTERITVISGTLHLGAGETFDPAKTTALPAGSVSVMEAKMNHFAWTKEETIVQVHGVGPWGFTYVNPADDPRKK
jgi:quercetin dioxygenase-like cupin family protein